MVLAGINCVQSLPLPSWHVLGTTCRVNSGWCLSAEEGGLLHLSIFGSPACPVAGHCCRTRLFAGDHFVVSGLLSHFRVSRQDSKRLTNARSRSSRAAASTFYRALVVLVRCAHWSSQWSKDGTLECLRDGQCAWMRSGGGSPQHCGYLGPG